MGNTLPMAYSNPVHDASIPPARSDDPYHASYEDLFSYTEYILSPSLLKWNVSVYVRSTYMTPQS